MKKSTDGVIAFLNPPISARTLANMLHNLPEYMVDIDDAENIVIYLPPRTREDMGQ